MSNESNFELNPRMQCTKMGHYPLKLNLTNMCYVLLVITRPFGCFQREVCGVEGRGGANI